MDFGVRVLKILRYQGYDVSFELSVRSRGDVPKASYAQH